MIKKIIFFILIIFLITVVYLKFIKETADKTQNLPNLDDELYNTNVLKNVEYISEDPKGNKYIVRAETGEIDYDNPSVIFLKNVKSLIKLENTEEINITSKFGKYNTNNYDTIFSKNVMITYLDNKIEGEYLDFSLEKNRMIISRNVIYTNLENILKADVVEINIKTKDTKIFMYEENKKVNIKNKIIRWQLLKNSELNHLRTIFQ